MAVCIKMLKSQCCKIETKINVPELYMKVFIELKLQLYIYWDGSYIDVDKLNNKK